MGLITSSTLPEGVTSFVAIDGDCYATNVIYTETEGYECWNYYSDGYEPYNIDDTKLFIYEV
jgi:hypothetical protein